MDVCSLALLQSTTSKNADTIVNPCPCSIQDGETLHPNRYDFGWVGPWFIGGLQRYPWDYCDPIQFGWPY
jgi:hypothetical protein